MYECTAKTCTQKSLLLTMTPPLSPMDFEILSPNRPSHEISNECRTSSFNCNAKKIHFAPTYMYVTSFKDERHVRSGRSCTRHTAVMGLPWASRIETAMVPFSCSPLRHVVTPSVLAFNCDGGPGRDLQTICSVIHVAEISKLRTMNNKTFSLIFTFVPTF